jgi:hypothetical protein
MDHEDLYQQLSEALNPLDDAYHALRALSRMMDDELPCMPRMFQGDCTVMLRAILEGMHTALERLEYHIERLEPREDDGRQVNTTE